MSSDTVPVTQAASFAEWLKRYVGMQDANKMRFSVAELKIAFETGRATPSPSPAMPSREEIARIAKAAIENSWRSAPGFDTDHDHMAKCVADALALTSVDRASETGWMPIETAPRNSTLVDLVVDYSDGEHPLNDAILACTIGFNGFDDNGEDEWKFAGWCWTHDHWVQGKGRPVAWRPSRLNAYDDGLPPLPALSSIGSEAE